MKHNKWAKQSANWIIAAETFQCTEFYQSVQKSAPCGSTFNVALNFKGCAEVNISCKYIV